ncbi:MAG TPA: KedN5 family methylcobalamin-dependent radical SAM C-methyltransferase [Mycobacteriales bacterium]
MSRFSARRTVWIVQQGVWDMPKESMPLAAGYLKAAAMANEDIRGEMDIRIFNFGGGDSVTTVAGALFENGAPDVLAMSVFGWNYRPFGHVTETFKQLNPDGYVIVGGTHVAHQAERTFRHFPTIDVVVNTEGEFVFRDLLLAFLQEREVADLHDIGGISFRDDDGHIVTTEPPPRIPDLDAVPSPVLTGAIPLTDHHGEFRYDVALMETNRGCPYKCAFCFWGGAVGQKVRAFSRERLREELDVFAFHKVHTIVLCDANFGMLRDDQEFMEDVIRTREKHGYPRSVEGSWAKNKSKVFYEIVRRMKAEGMQSSFTLALQTLDDSALEQMHRRNMKLNDWEDLVGWLKSEGLDCYAELIWGSPGETPESFLEGYDRLAKHMTRIAVYPLLLLPNTEYSEHRDKFGFTTVRGDQDDFEYVLSNSTMTIAQNQQMKRFMVWARAFAEHLVLRRIWAPLRELAGLSQSETVISVMEWFGRSSLPAAVHVTAVADRIREQPSALPEFLNALYSEPSLDALLQQWWQEAVAPRLPAEHADLLAEIFRFDLLTRPIFDPADVSGSSTVRLPLVDVSGEPYYARPVERFDHDVPAVLDALDHGRVPSTGRRPTDVGVFLKAGFHQHYANHEQGVYFVGRTEDELRRMGVLTGSLRPLAAQVAR